MENIKFSKIYKVFSTLNNSVVYIGSTTKKYLSSRMAEHRSRYKLWKEKKVGKSMIYDIFDEYGVDSCIIELLENINDYKNNLLYRERYYIETLNTVNKNRPIITINERKEAVKTNYLIYKEKNEEKIKIYQKNYREIIKKLKKNSLEIRNLFKELNSNI